MIEKPPNLIKTKKNNQIIVLKKLLKLHNKNQSFYFWKRQNQKQDKNLKFIFFLVCLILLTLAN